MKRLLRPVIERLEDRTLLDATGWFDSPWRGYNTGLHPQVSNRVMATADMDADGDIDAVVGHDFTGGPGGPYSDAGLSVLKNAGDGTFQSSQFVRLPSSFERYVGGIELADIDSDGDPDAIASVYDWSSNADYLAYFRNVGGGKLQRRAVTFITGNSPRGIVVGDFTGDGFPDAVTSSFFCCGLQSISLLRHNGLTGPAAGFLAPESFGVGEYPQGLDAADLNADGRLDLAVAHTDGHPTEGELSILLNNGNGFDSPTVYINVPGAYYSAPNVKLADLDNDGDHDLISGGFFYEFNPDQENGAISVRRNGGNGAFGPAEVYIASIYLGTTAEHFDTGDLNGDGFLDVAASTEFDDRTDGYYVMLSDGQGGFTNPVFYEAALDTFGVAIENVDGDADLDLLTVARASAQITVHRNPGNGIFPVPATYFLGDLAWGYGHADIDNDGDLDVVVNHADPISPAWYTTIRYNEGDGTFPIGAFYETTLKPRDLKLRDLNGDGFVDLLTMSAQGTYFMAALNDGAGYFLPDTYWYVGACGETWIEGADFDNDGDTDVAVVEDCFGDTSLYLYENDGTANFTQVGVIDLVNNAMGVSAADVNHDGNMDLIVSALYHGSQMGIFLGNGDLTFQFPLLYDTSGFPYVLADFNGDAKLDMAILYQDLYIPTMKVVLAIGNGNGTFKNPKFFTTLTDYGNASLFNRDIDAADINGDGLMDVLVTSQTNATVSLLLGKADGTLAKAEHYGMGVYHPKFTGFADFNGDNVPDVVSVFSWPPDYDGGFGLSTGLVFVAGRISPAPAPLPNNRLTTGAAVRPKTLVPSQGADEPWHGNRLHARAVSTVNDVSPALESDIAVPELLRFFRQFVWVESTAVDERWPTR